MAVHNTSGFTFTVDGTAVAGIVDATVTLNTETVDVTELGNTARTYVAGITNGTASGNLFYDVGDAGVAALQAAALSGAEIACVFTLYTSTTITASAIVTSWTPSVAIADVVRVAFELQFTGTVSDA
jgi:predicted secreted protein